MTGSTRPPRQSANICAPCRARKVRCDGRRDTCSNCERLHFTCTYEAPQKKAPQPSVSRRRGRVACLNCYARRVRCDEGRPSCQRCSRLSLQCAYGNSTSSPLPGGTTPRSVAGNLSDAEAASFPSHEIAKQALKVFFRRVCQIPVFAFLHQACVSEQYKNGVLDRPLLLSLIGIVTVFDNQVQEGSREAGERCIDIAADLVVAGMEKPTVPKIQALIFIIKYRAFQRRFSSVFVLSAIALRFATGLRLNYEDPQLSFLAQESCRRTMWSLYLIDSALAAGYQDFTLSGADMIHIKLPCKDANFEMDLPPEPSENAPSSGPSPSPVSLIVRMFKLRNRVLQFTKKAVAPSMSKEDIREGMQTLRDELDSFGSALPAPFKFSKHNAMLQSYSPTMPAFLAIHVIWHNCQCTLHRLVLAGLVESLSEETIAGLDPDFRRNCEMQCFESATRAVDVLEVVVSKRAGKDSLDPDVAVSVYQCLRILIRSHREVSDRVGDTVEVVKARCAIGMKFLTTMFPDTAASNAIIKDTETLIQDNLGSPSASELDGQAISRRDHAQSHHVLSKHSYVGQIDMPDKAEAFNLSPSVNNQAKTTPTPHDQTVVSSPRTVPDQTPTLPDDLVPPDGNAWAVPAFDGSLYQFTDLTLPHFGLDSSIFLPHGWMGDEASGL